jgi:Zn finger protein HypA/HybF involved in hydrogenase expression
VKFIWWSWFGQKYELKQIVELLWPEQDTLILNCPACDSPCATTKNHTIISVEPLTHQIPLTCPYCKTKTFKVEEGKLMPA